MKQGYFTPEAAEAIKVVYPAIYEAIKQEFMQRLPEFKNITERQKSELSRILGLNAKKAYTPQGFATLQAVSTQGVQQEFEQKARVGITAAKNINSSNRASTGIDKVINRA
jgi:hypothetical protein